MMQIEGTGNTEEEAKQALDRERAAVAAQMDARFGEVRKYGNMEYGYKLVQEYEPKI
ncbi:MAG: hypothetical protein ABW134_11860 [Candidatus Thiodiazotropha endolucinida]